MITYTSMFDRKILRSMGAVLLVGGLSCVTQVIDSTQVAGAIKGW